MLKEATSEEKRENFTGRQSECEELLNVSSEALWPANSCYNIVAKNKKKKLPMLTLAYSPLSHVYSCFSLNTHYATMNRTYFVFGGGGAVFHASI